VSETGSASNISETDAMLQGQINPEGQVTEYVFEYGTTTAYGASTPTPPGTIVGAGVCGIPCEITTPQPVSANVTGLEPGTTYHYRLASRGAQSATDGQDAIFTTASLSSGTKPPSSTSDDQSMSSPIVAALTPVALSTTSITTTTTPKLKMTGNALKLEKALQACAKKPKKQRAKCEHQAHGKYAMTAKKG
jgi:hypothetical protein